MQLPLFFSQLQQNYPSPICTPTASDCRHILTGRLSPPLSLAPGQFLRPPCTAWRPYRFGLHICPPFCPPRNMPSVDNSTHHALRDSKCMRPSTHQAETLRCNARPETGKRSAVEGMQDHQLGGSPLQDRKCIQYGGYEENEYRVRHHVSDVTPDRIPKVPRRTKETLG